MNSEEVTPDKAFAQLGNETRIRIVQELGDTDEPLRFSELKERVGTRDSGQFNYHLDQLVGTFLRKTDDDRYELSYAGGQVVGAILSGEYNRQGTDDRFTLDRACPNCGSQIEATYENERVEVQCPACDEFLSGFGFPPGGFEGRSDEELPSTFNNWVLGLCRLAIGGICFNCLGAMTGSLSDEKSEFHEGQPVFVRFRCNRCANQTTMAVNSYLSLHSVVISFLYDHGVDVFDGELWDLEFLREDTLSIRSTEPLVVESTIELDGDGLTLVVEDDLSVRTV